MRERDRASRRVGSLLCAFVAVAALAAGQNDARFDPLRDLEGFQDCRLSEYSELYAFDDFEAKKGEPLAPGELERLREAWRAERVRVLREIERIETDPAALGEYRFGRRLARHPYFAKQSFELVRDHEPYLFAVQRTLEADALDPARVAGTLAPWLKELAAAFDDELARPLELERRSGFELLPIVVLASRGAFDDYVRVAWKLANRDTLAQFDEEQQLLVLHQDRVDAGNVPPDRRLHENLREAARLLLYAHAAPTSAWPKPFWLQQGLADWLARNDGRAPASLRKDRPSGMLARGAVDLLRDDASRLAWWLPLDELVRIESWGDAVERARARQSTAGAPPPTGAAFGARVECAALVRSMLRADGPDRARFLEATRQALAGSGAPDPFADLFAPSELARVQRELVSAAWDDQRALFPAIAAKSAELERVLAALGISGAAEPASTASTLATPASLAQALNGEGRLALALARARRGDAEGAAALLEELAAGADPERERALRELARVRAWIALRDRFLAHVASSGEEISVEHAGEVLRARIARFAEGRVRFQQNRQRIESLAANELDPLELAKEMGMKKLAFEADWARAYPYVLRELATWKSLLGSGADEQALRADAEGDYPARRRAIDAAERIDALASLPPPVDGASASRISTELGALCAEGRELEFVTVLRPLLADLARSALEVQFRESGLPGCLRASVQELGDGTLRLSYDFAAAEQLADFPSVEPAGYPPGHGVEPATAEPRSEWSEGRLALRGNVARRHVLDFEGPMRLAFTYREDPEGADSGSFFFLAALCASQGGYLGCLNGFYVEAFDKVQSTFHRAPDKDPASYFLDTDFEIELTHDGARSAEMKRVGEVVASVPVEALTSGGVLFWVRSDRTIRFDSIMIEGRPTAASLEALRAGWMAERLVELGLDAGR